MTRHPNVFSDWLRSGSDSCHMMTGNGRSCLLYVNLLLCGLKLRYDLMRLDLNLMKYLVWMLVKRNYMIDCSSIINGCYGGGGDGLYQMLNGLMRLGVVDFNFNAFCLNDNGAFRLRWQVSCWGICGNDGWV